ncbi:MAG: hypothetical protein Q9N26_00320 [Aquificota bacterium]|nr:hypothetical protein [Aquificota bacterium]MDQ7082087.1 hypothetical protein [Aquificota bacterium]
MKRIHFFRDYARERFGKRIRKIPVALPCCNALRKVEGFTLAY